MAERQHPGLIALRALLQGHVLEAEGYRYCLSAEDRLCIVAKTERGGVPGEDVLLVSDMSFDHFMKMCLGFTEEQVALLSMNNALTSLARRV